MTDVGGAKTSFAQRIKARETLFGTFIKVPTTHTTEVVGSVGFDFIVIDEEHAPFDRRSTDGVILASLASGMPAIVRVGDPSPANILAALDCGATGVMVPHIDSAEKAARAAAACRYRSGSRGFSRTGRAGGYGGVGVREHLDRQDAETLCIAMIEDVEALARIDAIAATEGVDAFFIGRGDLSVAMGEVAASAPRVLEAVKVIAAAVAGAGKPLLTLAENLADREAMAKLGASSFLVGSDLAFLRRAAHHALAEHVSFAS
jgi:staphyloferrin B biosynthesis citrate synthase